MGERSLVTLFTPEPGRWGLRGDPHVWRAMRAEVEGLEPPPTPALVVELLHAVFRTLVGVELTADDLPDEVFRQEFDHGGMSGGMVSLRTWQARLMPLLEERAAALFAG